MIVKCTRCGQETEGLKEAPYNNAMGQMILKNTCPKCFEEWKKFSVMVINDYKLRPFLPQDRSVLEKHMKQFLNLEGQGLQQPQALTGQGKNITFETAQKAGSETPQNPLKEKVIEMLEQIYDPEVPVNIYDLGLIYDVAISPNNEVKIQMTLTSQHCPAAQSLPAAVKEAVKRVPGVKEAEVQVVWDPPWSKEKITEEGRQILGM